MTSPAPTHRWVLITGGARRVGAALTRAFARAGWAVALHHAHSAEAARALTAELAAVGLGPFAVLRADLSAPDGPARLLDALDAALGDARPRALVNNAALFPAGPTRDLEAAAIDEALAVNVRAPMLLTAGLCQRGGLESVVNVADCRVGGAWRERALYMATKEALVAFTRTAALDLAPGVRVNALAPGTMMTPAGCDEATLAAMRERIPGQALIDVDQLARLAVALCDDLRSVSGAVWRIDGAEHLA